MEINNGRPTAFNAEVFAGKARKDQKHDLEAVNECCTDFLREIHERLGSKSLEQRRSEITNIENEWRSYNEVIQQILDASKNFPADSRRCGKRNEIVNACAEIAKAIEVANEVIREEENVNFNAVLNYAFGEQVNYLGVDRRLEDFDPNEFGKMNARGQKNAIHRAGLVCRDLIKTLELLRGLPDDQRRVGLESLKKRWEDDSLIIYTIINEASQVDEVKRPGVRNKLNKLNDDANLINGLICSFEEADNVQLSRFDVIKAAIKKCFDAVGNVLTSAMDWCKQHPVVTCLIATCIIGTVVGVLYANTIMAAVTQIASAASQAGNSTPVVETYSIMEDIEKSSRVITQKVESCACNYKNAFAQAQCRLDAYHPSRKE